MNAKTIKRKSLTKVTGRGIGTFLKTLSEAEMDRRLDEQHDEVVAMLAEARAQWERGEFAPLAPLDAFLNEEREHFEAAK